MTYQLSTCLIRHLRDACIPILFLLHFLYLLHKLVHIHEKLQLKGLSNYAFETEGFLPHITLADFEDLPLNKAVTTLTNDLLIPQPIPITFNSLGSFLGTNIVFLSPVISPALASLHLRIHELFSDNVSVDSLYGPESWQPHLTLANRIDPTNFPKLYELCHQHFSKMESKIVGLKLIHIDSPNKISSLFDYSFVQESSSDLKLS